MSTGVPGGGVDDVGAEDREVRVLGDAPGEVRQALVEFVVAGGAGLQTEGVEVVQGRLIILDGGDEQARGDVVPRGEEEAVGVCGALLLQGGGQAHPDLRGDAAVEVVDVEQGELGGPGLFDGVGGRCSGQQDEQGGDGGPERRWRMVMGSPGKTMRVMCATVPSAGEPRVNTRAAVDDARRSGLLPG
ncbi:hypothetical protein A5N15_12460 [Rothia kristinae]|uniref:Uncharacterized protein n=1 Tax=Rothia kristinae TaxID=37923 RepID=A0A657ITF1_9MICC|nr:hypothetical protein A5N15_12460 [Rothia kristinae]